MGRVAVVLDSFLGRPPHPPFCLNEPQTLSRAGDTHPKYTPTSPSIGGGRLHGIEPWVDTADARKKVLARDIDKHGSWEARRHHTPARVGS